MKRPNEHNVCDAFITILRSLTDIENWESESPDEVNRSTPDVDFVLVSRSNEYDKIAVEHTRVESFDGQIGYVNRSYDIVSSINSECRNRIPDSHFYVLTIPPKIINSLVGKRRVEFVSYLSSWVAESTPKLLVVDSYTQTKYKGHKITLMCGGDTAKLNGNVWRIPEAPEHQNALQIERLGRAVKDKLPKLMKYKEQGFKTALLLEDVAGTLRGSTLSDYKKHLEEVDYVVVFVSIKDQMIIGNLWKDGSVWDSSVPMSRRFSF